MEPAKRAFPEVLVSEHKEEITRGEEEVALDDETPLGCVVSLFVFILGLTIGFFLASLSWRGFFL